MSVDKKVEMGTDGSTAGPGDIIANSLPETGSAPRVKEPSPKKVPENVAQIDRLKKIVTDVYEHLQRLNLLLHFHEMRIEAIGNESSVFCSWSIPAEDGSATVNLIIVANKDGLKLQSLNMRRVPVSGGNETEYPIAHVESLEQIQPQDIQNALAAALQSSGSKKSAEIAKQIADNLGTHDDVAAQQDKSVTAILDALRETDLPAPTILSIREMDTSAVHLRWTNNSNTVDLVAGISRDKNDELIVRVQQASLKVSDDNSYGTIDLFSLKEYFLDKVTMTEIARAADGKCTEAIGEAMGVKDLQARKDSELKRSIGGQRGFFSRWARRTGLIGLGVLAGAGSGTRHPRYANEIADAGIQCVDAVRSGFGFVRNMGKWDKPDRMYGNAQWVPNVQFEVTVQGEDKEVRNAVVGFDSLRRHGNEWWVTLDDGTIVALDAVSASNMMKQLDELTDYVKQSGWQSGTPITDKNLPRRVLLNGTRVWKK